VNLFAKKQLLGAFRGLAWIAIAVFLMPTGAGAGEKHVKLMPELHSGQILRYDIHGRVQQHIKTESHVTNYKVPRDLKEEFSAVLRITVSNVGTENGRPVVSGQSEFEYPADGGAGSAVVQKHLVEFTIGGNGQLKKLSGLDDLEKVEQLAWRFWISQFAFGWTITGQNVKAGEAWKSEQGESSPGPIAHLYWERETTVGESSKCPVRSGEGCMAFLTTALLKQKSSPKDSTPEDYRLHELRTSGTASGKNEAYDSISEATGLLMRGTEDVRQAMEVVIAKADASNAVKYTMEAGSHFEAVLVD